MLGIESKPCFLSSQLKHCYLDNVVSVPPEGHLKGVFSLAGKKEVCAKIFQECVPLGLQISYVEDSKLRQCLFIHSYLVHFCL